MFDGDTHHHHHHQHPAHAHPAHAAPHHMMSNDAIFNRFRKLGNWERIDFMCGLLDLCHPFEVRYLGTFIEELGRKDYETLKKYEEKANTGENSPKEFVNLEDNSVRANLVISLTLLSSGNAKVATVIYNILHTFMDQYIQSASYHKDGAAFQEYLLLLILAVSHPAFTIEQKQCLRRHIDILRNDSNFYPLPRQVPNQHNAIDNIHRQRFNDTREKCHATTTKLNEITLRVSECAKRLQDGRSEQLVEDEVILHIDVTWSDSRKNEVLRSLNEVSILERDMRHELLGMKKNDVSDEIHQTFSVFRDCIPSQFKDDPPADMKNALYKFINDLTKLPREVLDQMFMRRFLGRMDSRSEHRGRGIQNRVPTPRDPVEESFEEIPVKHNEDSQNMFWWLKFHHLEKYFSYFKDMKLNELINNPKECFRNQNMKQIPHWVRDKIVSVIAAVTTGNRTTNSRTPQTPDPDDINSHPSDDDFMERRNHKDSNLSHSTSAPNIGGYRSRPGDDSSDESRSTSQQDSRPGSSRDQDRRDQDRQLPIQINGPHQMYGNIHSQQNPKYSQQSPMPQQPMMMVPTNMPAYTTALQQAQAEAERHEKMRRMNHNNDQNPQIPISIPNFGPGIPVLPPPLVGPGGRPQHMAINGNLLRYPMYAINTTDGPNMPQVIQQQLQHQLQQMSMDPRPPTGHFPMPFQQVPLYNNMPHPPTTQSHNMRHHFQDMRQQQNQNQNKHPGGGGKKSSCYRCGGQGHNAQDCTVEPQRPPDGSGGPENYGIKFASTQNPNQNPLDRVESQNQRKSDN